MGNKHSTYLQDPSIQGDVQKFDALEVHMLYKIFEDLAARDDGVIDRETFLQFFPLTGLWGEKLFNKFDNLKVGHVNWAGWVKGIATCCRSTEAEQVESLFQLYDQDNDGFIERKDLITMLYNYPKAHIKKITDEIAPDKGSKIQPVDEERRKSVTSLIMIQKEEKKQTGDQDFPDTNEGKIIQYDSRKNIAKESGASSSYFLTGPPKVIATDETDGRTLNIITHNTSVDKNEKSIAKAPQKQTISIQQMSTSHLIVDQSFLQASTVGTRVNQYASIVFKSLDQNSKGKIGLEDFKEWIKIHPNILKVFTEGFHQEIWGLSNVAFSTDGNTDNRFKLEFHRKKPDQSGILYKKGRRSGKWIPRYYELRENFLYYWTKKETELPKKMFFLSHCIMEATNDFFLTKKHGFTISHKSTSYRNKFLYCNTQDELDAWLDKFKGLQASVHDTYNFKEKIGMGKFSVVYHACAKNDPKKEYAIKVMDKGKLKPSEIEFILLETQVMQVLDHPHIIKLIETIETKTSIYIVTEIVKDGDLFDYIVSQEFLEEYQAAHIMTQLFKSFNYLHTLGVIHRDIKPENILISVEKDSHEVKDVKIIDFGFAKFITKDMILKETCGTPNYVAPEILKGTGYDKRADIWSLGVILYMMLRGRLPFDAEDVDEILKNTISQDLALDDYHWRRISEQGRDLVGRLLNKDPAKRISIFDALNHPWTKNEGNFLKKYKGANRGKAE